MKKNIRPRYWPDIYKSSFNFIRKLKLHEETIPSNQQTRELIRLRLFDKISLGLDIGTSFLLVQHELAGYSSATLELHLLPTATAIRLTNTQWNGIVYDCQNIFGASK